MKNPNLLHRFRNVLYSHLTNRADTILEIVDTLCTDHRARSTVELSLSPTFSRGHDSLYAAIDAFHLPSYGWRALRQVVVEAAPPREVLVLSLDVTGHPRPYAPTLADRSFIYHPTPVRGNRPVNIGHRYSLLFFHPPRRAGEPAWAPPLCLQRVPSHQDPEVAGAHQVLALVAEGRAMGWLPKDCPVLVLGDTKYSKPAVVDTLAQDRQVLLLARLRSNRVFYKRQPPPSQPRRPGRPRLYGARLALNDSQPALPPDEEVCVPDEEGDGHWEISLWHHMIARGRADHPVTLVRVRRLNAQGEPVHPRPWWFQLSGACRERFHPHWGMTYSQRYDGEHTLRFLKQRLLATRYQTPDVDREAHWWHIVQLAYWQLWVGRTVIPGGRYPWQKGLPPRIPGPGDVQRGFGGILTTLEHRPRPVKRRGKSPGWPRGHPRKPRPRYTVVSKGTSRSRKRA